jgi:hypothetical protein
MKKVILILATALTLVACKNKNQNEKQTDNNSVKSILIDTTNVCYQQSFVYDFQYTLNDGKTDTIKRVSNQPNFNPFSATNLNDSAFAVAKVVDIVVDHNAETGQNTAKLVVELQNNKKLSSISTSYYFKQSTGSANKLLLVSSVEVLIDPKGAYSRLDVPVGSSDKLAITLQSGKAYVFGYEYETFAPRVVEYVNSGNQPSIKPSKQPSNQPSFEPSAQPYNQPSLQPRDNPTMIPSVIPSNQPTFQPLCCPSNLPSKQPSAQPSAQPSTEPSFFPSNFAVCLNLQFSTLHESKK